MTALTEAALLREVAVLQRDKTLQLVRDLVEVIPTKEDSSRSYSQTDRSAAAFKRDLLNHLKRLGEQ